MIKKWLIKNNNEGVSLKSFYNKTKEFADKVIINYNLDNYNYVGINLIEKDYDQKEKSMTLEKLWSMLLEFKTELIEFKSELVKLNEKVDNGFKEVNSRIDKLEKNFNDRLDKLERCPTISDELKNLN